MKMIKVLTSGNLSYAYNKSSDLKKKLEKDRKEEHLNEVKFLVANDRDYEKLMLFVILSPIFIACFDSSSQELDFLGEEFQILTFPTDFIQSFSLLKRKNIGIFI